MADHLWPARPGYLRRGTPVDHLIVGGEPGAVVAYVTGDTITSAPRTGLDEEWVLIIAWGDGMPSEYMRPTQIGHWVRLDLRDVTARAHAAWAHHIWRRGTPYLADHLPMGSAHGSVLTRMAHGDPAVTVAEARAALAWAESRMEADDG